jgi:hypothetical protein
MISAVLASAVSVADAMYHGLTGQFLLDESRSPAWVDVTVAVLLAATFALLAAVLSQRARTVDAGSRWVRWVRRVMQADLIVLSAGSLTILLQPLIGKAAIDRLSSAVGGLSFGLMFLLSVILGGLLLRRRDQRLPATLMAAPLAIIPLLLLLNQVAPGWAHPAYAETAVYLGLALARRSRAAVDARAVPVVTAPARVR